MLKIVSWVKQQFGRREQDPWLDRVREMVTWADSLRVRDQEVSGERKRNQVLNRLKQEFPNFRTRDIAYAIEYVIQERCK